MGLVRIFDEPKNSSRTFAAFSNTIDMHHGMTAGGLDLAELMSALTSALSSKNT